MRLSLSRMMLTAIVSPIARPSPSIDAPTMPFRENGRITLVIIPHRVPPRPSAASHWSRGTCDITSREIDATIGSTMIPTMSPASNSELPSVVPTTRNGGKKSACWLSHFVVFRSCGST